MAYKRRPGSKEPEMGLLTEDRKEELRIEAEAKVTAERIMLAEREYAASPRGGKGQVRPRPGYGGDSHQPPGQRVPAAH